MIFTVTTGSPNSIAFQKAFRGATVGCTLQVFIIAFRFAYQAQVIVTEKKSTTVVRRYLWLTGSLGRLTPTVMTRPAEKLPKGSVPVSFSMMKCVESVDSWRFIKILWEFNICMAIKCAEFVWPRQIWLRNAKEVKRIFFHMNFVTHFLLWRFQFHWKQHQKLQCEIIPTF